MAIMLEQVGLSFDDVLLVPQYSSVLPGETDLRTRLTKNIFLNIPFVSAAMDSVTESRMAIAMARAGGIGVIHKNLSPEDQAHEVKKVKRAESGMIADPVTIAPDASIADAKQIMETQQISGLPVCTGERQLVGLITGRDIRSADPTTLVSQAMTPPDKLITIPEDEIRMDIARELLHQHRIEKLPVVDKQFRLVGLLTFRDLRLAEACPLALKDKEGCLRVSAAVGPGDALKRADLLVRSGVDAIVVDTAHGHSKGVLYAVERLKERFPHLNVIGGNIATGDAAESLISAGADTVKVGIGPGSICTTRAVAGVGFPQLSAIMNVAEVARIDDTPVIADGGIKYSGDAAKALAAGADCVMMGSQLAGTEETPGETSLYQGRVYKSYRGMGSLGAMRKGSKDRYGQAEVGSDKLVPEGIEGRVPYRGAVNAILHQFCGGVRSSMGYQGVQSIRYLHKNAVFVRMTNSGLRESHVHGVDITEEPPNYRRG